MLILTPNPNIRFYARDKKHDPSPSHESDWKVVKENFSENVYQITPGDFYDTGIFIDVGANIGSVSIFVASMERREGQPPIQVIAYEPERDNLSLLRKNLAVNDIRNVEVRTEAVYTTAGKMDIVPQGGGSTLVWVNGRFEGSDKTYPVSVVTLHTVLMGLSDGCDVLKWDCEGAEFDVFTQATTQDLMKIRYLTMEFSEDPYDKFGSMVTRLAEVFNLHILGRPSTGGYIYGRRY
jgi:FkbM family methyltransferase